MRWLPHLTVACIVENNGKLLFVEEFSNGNKVLNQPAGHVEKGETLMQAAIRETFEESACEVQLKNIVGMYSHYSKEKNIGYYRVCYRTKLIQENKNQELDSDIIQTLWLTPEQAIKEQSRFRSPFVKNCIEDYLAGNSYPLELITELNN
jgi:8-oxo-dGTP pyrophosphatase MutT (NUDIX family)